METGAGEREPCGGVLRLMGMRTSRVVVLIAGLGLLAAACGADEASQPTVAATTTSAGAVSTTTSVPSPSTVSEASVSGVYFVDGTLLDKEGVGPELCNFVNTSLPPQCRGLPVNGVDWDEVPGAESAGDTKWAYVRIVGTFDGTSLTLTEPPTEPGDRQHETQDFTSPCPEPAGGWAIRDPALVDDTDWNRARIYGESQPDFAGLWVDQLLEPGERENEEHDAKTFVANLTFTGSLDEHQAALEEIYGGPLCVSQGLRPLAELRAIQDTVVDVLSTPEAIEAGIHVGYGMGSSANQFRGVVEVSVMVITNPDAQTWVDDEFGPGLVEVRSYLQPVK